MPNKPLISIITVTYNAEATLPATLDSLRGQKGCTAGTDYEYIVMDGKSKDNTVSIAKSCGIEGMRIFSEPDNGIYEAMNKAMDVAHGSYYIFLNSGDSFHEPDTLRTIIDTIRQNDMPGIVYGQTMLVDSDRKVVGPRHLTAPPVLTYESFANGMSVCHQAFVALARIAPHYDMRYRYSADYEWCLQCLQHSRRNVYIDSTLIDYLSEGTTTRHRYASLIERFRIMCYYFGTLQTIMRHLRFIPRFIKQRRKSK